MNIGIIIACVIGFIVLMIVLGSIKVVSTGEAYIVEKLGVYNRTLGAGIYILTPFVEHVVRKVSLKTQTLDSEPQSVITKDNVIVEVDTVTFYKVMNAHDCVYNMENFEQAIEYTITTNMRNIIGEMTLDEVLSGRDKMNSNLLKVVDKITDEYGIKIISSEIKNITPPENILQSMEQLMTSQKDKQAKITKAEGEKQAVTLEAQAQKGAAILNAEAKKQSAILEAEASKESQKLKAEGEKQAIELQAEAKAEAIKKVKDALGNTEQYLQLKKVEALNTMGASKSSKIVVPDKIMDSLGTVSAIAETIKK